MDQIRQSVNREGSTSRYIQVHQFRTRTNQHSNTIILQLTIRRSSERKRHEIPSSKNCGRKNGFRQDTARHAIHRKNFQLARVSRQVDQRRRSELRTVGQPPTSKLRAVGSDGSDGRVGDERTPPHVDVLQTRASLRGTDDAAVSDCGAEGNIENAQCFHGAQVLEGEIIGGTQAVQARHGEDDEILEIGKDLVECFSGYGIDVAEVEQAEGLTATCEGGCDVVAGELSARRNVEEAKERGVLTEEADCCSVQERRAVQGNFFQVETAILKQNLETTVVEAIRISGSFGRVLELAKVFGSFGLTSEI